MGNTPYSVYGYFSLADIGFSTLSFTGQLRDKLTGCYLLGNGYRGFSPTLMRFIIPDIFSPFDIGGINPYCYCSGDPINKYDPTGEAGVPKQPSSFPPAGGFRFKGRAENINKVQVFYSPDPENPGSTILNINMHGSRGFFWDGYRPMRVKKFFKTLEKRGYPLSNQRTHYITCYSANKPFFGLFGKSVIEQTVKITKAPSTGYKGPVTSYPDRPKSEGQFSDITINIDVKNPFRPDHPSHHKFRYKPVTAFPKTMGSIRQPDAGE